MGTHISKVKSVDLDSWTDEQLQSMLKWGNARANMYEMVIHHTIQLLINI
jgi:stromal membrane-associated protein